MSKTTYELINEATEIVAMLDDNGGELTEDLDKQIAEWLDGCDDKSGALLYARNAARARQAEAADLIEIFKAQKARHKRSEARIVKYQTKLLQGMEAAIGKRPKVTGIWGSVSLRTSQNVEVWDVEALPIGLTAITVRAEKAKIKKALKRGEEIEGAALIDNVTAAWRTK
jgi:hypothetical protein